MDKTQLTFKNAILTSNKMRHITVTNVLVSILMIFKKMFPCCYENQMKPTDRPS